MINTKYIQVDGIYWEVLYGNKKFSIAWVDKRLNRLTHYYELKYQDSILDTKYSSNILEHNVETIKNIYINPLIKFTCIIELGNLVRNRITAYKLNPDIYSMNNDQIYNRVRQYDLNDNILYDNFNPTPIIPANFTQIINYISAPTITPAIDTFKELYPELIKRIKLQIELNNTFLKSVKCKI